jgi:acetyl esterase
MGKYRFDPELAAAVVLLPDSQVTDIATIRRLDAEYDRDLGEADLTGLVVEDRTVPGFESEQVRVRVYRPVGGQRSPAVLHLHPGGFVSGTIDTDQIWKAELSRELGVTVVSVDYRLAPEHPYPAALEDCYAALRWLADEATELAVDPSRVAVFGQSAGGGLAAALTLLARDRGGPEICFQMLVQPELDDRMASTSMQAFTDTPVWNRPRATMSWDAYLGADRRAIGAVPIYAAPARATDLAGLPPAYLSVAEFDPLRDEGISYASALLQAGVRTELHVFPGTFHGSSIVVNAPVTQRESAECIRALCDALSL